MRIFLIFVLFLCSCNRDNTPKPDDSGNFIKFFGSSNHGFTLVESQEGTYFIAGSYIDEGKTDEDVCIIRVDKNGNLIWKKLFGTPNDDRGLDMKIDSDGNIVIVGFVTNNENHTNGYVLKLNADGDLLKSLEIGDSNKNEKLYKIIENHEGHLILAGVINNINLNDKNLFLAQTNMDTLFWQREIGVEGAYDEFGSTIENENHQIIFCGSIKRFDEYDSRLISTTAEGNILWDFSYGEKSTKNEYGKSLLMNDKGNLIVTSTEEDNLTKNTDIIIAEYTMSGKLLWEKHSNIPFSKVNSIVQAQDGTYMVAGLVKISENNTDYLAVKFSEVGDVIWYKKYGGSGLDEAIKVIATKDGGYGVIGSMNTVHNYMMGFIKLDKNGEIPSL
jgi:hypothetical protein